MTHEQIQDNLSAWMDGELDDATGLAVEGHLAGCPACRAVADGLTQVAGVAARLPVRPPERNLWPGIEARIRAPQVSRLEPVRRRRLLQPWMGLVAAGLGVGVVLGAMGGQAGTRGRPDAVTPGRVDAATPGRVRPAVLNSEHLSRSTGVAVGQLEQLLLTQTRQLDTSTVRVLVQNLARIDSAIADAERALAVDPSNAYVSRHLATTTKRKVDLLRRVAVLTQPRS
jgi:predicted anti-sigma-YlaC factor YlaD